MENQTSFLFDLFSHWSLEDLEAYGERIVEKEKPNKKELECLPIVQTIIMLKKCSR